MNEKNKIKEHTVSLVRRRSGAIAGEICAIRLRLFRAVFEQDNHSAITTIQIITAGFVRSASLKFKFGLPHY